MPVIRVAALAACILLGFAAGAKARDLQSESTGGDWLVAGVEERTEWSERMARIFNKEAPFANSVESCLTQTLGGEGIEDAALDEMRQTELPLLTAACITSIAGPPPSQ